ncbi:DUF5994 family protein [Streptantibioticus silvisoli]|uniref:DUF5994 family protein n=1 Tax=Streptantibioticus silvisoli TaxID=2705255 RepID=A0ABT6W6W3_9ACTN|nr:DUF5994 family protein [Streptantibioticus silvisoli]MDI5966481.1 DUF5994 family protein [Streptantibioticus silvisoli]
MTATTLRTTPPTEDPHSAPAPAARVAFVPAGPRRRRLDGAWWPRSRDLRAELPSLVAALDERFGRIGHLTVNNSLWPEVPRRVAVNGRTMHLGWFGAEQDPNEICVLSTRAGRWDLLVVPPETGAREAERLMASASAPDNALTARALLATVRGGGAADDRRPGEVVWETEGGATAVPA